MTTRNILDSLGNVIGQLSLDDATTEDQWTLALSPYAVASTPMPITIQSLSTTTVTGSGATTTSSATASVVGGMSVTTPTAGTYVAHFSGSIYTAGASATGEFGIYVAGTLVAETRRDISCNLTLLGGLVTISLNSIGVGTYTGSEIALTGSQSVEVKFRSTNGGTIGFNERVLTLLRVK